MWALGISEIFSPWSRVLAAFLNFGILMVFVAVAYGMLAETALQRRELLKNRSRLLSLRMEGAEHHRQHNELIISNVRTQLATALSLDQLDTPEHTLTVIRASIDEVIRPLSKKLGEYSSLDTEYTALPPARIELGRFIFRVSDLRELSILPGVGLFVLLMMSPLVNLFGPGLAVVLGSLMAVQLIIVTLGLRLILLHLRLRTHRWMSPVVLAVSAFVGLLIFVPLIPPPLQITFSFGYIGVYVFCSLVPVALRVAVEESRHTVHSISAENVELSWEVVRANHIAHLHNQVVSSALHGRVQAALTAAAVRLQFALRDGSLVDEALALARAEAEIAIEFDIDNQLHNADIGKTLADIRSLWEGMCTVESCIDKETIRLIDSDPICSRIGAELVMELCTNAIKHGAATKLLINAEFSSQKLLRIELSNNGVDFTDKTNGHGTSMLNKLSVDWGHATAPGSSTVVFVVLPWQPTAPDIQ